jgi:hypothetical protein
LGAIELKHQKLNCIQKGEAIRSTSWMAAVQAPMQKIRGPALAVGGKLNEL